jgi:hypothetical protein
VRTKKTSLNPKFFKAVERLILKGWTKEALARDEHGEPIDPCDPEACCFCTTGAIIKISDEWEISPGPYLVYLGTLAREADDSGLGNLTLNRYNDQKELTDIKKLLRRAARKVARKP